MPVRDKGGGLISTQVDSDVLCLDSSSFASLAYYCRGAAQPAVFGVKHVKDFFVSGRAAEWPPNLLYAHAAMQRAAEQPARIPAAWDEPLLAALERGLVLARGGLSDDENVSLFVH